MNEYDLINKELERLHKLYRDTKEFCILTQITWLTREVMGTITGKDYQEQDVENQE